jgi:hypothetical protein
MEDRAARPAADMNALLSLPGHGLTRRIAAFAGAILLMLGTAACFDNEPQQRKAFIEFLQTRVIDKPGLHVPIMSKKDIAKVGPYADHYRVLEGFHQRLDAKVAKDFQRAAKIGRPKSLEDLRNQRALFPIFAKTMATLHGELDKAEADADAARKALKQQPDLKAVYDTAFERMVTTPARAFREVLPLIDAMVPAFSELAAYLDDNRDKITLHGNQSTFQDAATRGRLAELLDNAQKMSAGAAAGQRKLQSMVTGR